MGGQRVAHVLFNLSSSSATGIIIQSHHTVNNTKTTSLRLKSSVWYALGGLCASSHFLSDVQCCSLREFITSRPHPVLHSHLFKESKQRSVLHLLLAHPCIPCLKGLLHLSSWSISDLKGHLKCCDLHSSFTLQVATSRLCQMYS